MKAPAALVIASDKPVIVGGLTLTERSVLHAHRAGCHPIAVRGVGPDTALPSRLERRGARVVRLPPTPATLGEGAIESARVAGVVVVGPNVLFGPTTVLTDLVASGSGPVAAPATACSASGEPLLLYVPGNRVDEVQAQASVTSMVAALSTRAPVRVLPGTGRFVREVAPSAHAGVERDLIRHLNGHESFFTTQIRRFSVPLSVVLVRLGFRPTQVTLLGFIVAIASAWCIGRGAYLWGVAGGVLCYASMVFDCSDGEVARLSLRDSAFGAWLETAVDYSTYFLLLAALVVAVEGQPLEHTHRMAAGIALGGSVVVAAIASYLRHRVAKADPGQFDEASANAMGASGFHRFARWGRQWIKRSSIAHLVLALSIADLLPVLLYLWAFGATVAALVILAVEPFVVREVKVAAAVATPLDASDEQGGRSCP
jgi:phosphatidylglycerophosphate synthase